MKRILILIAFIAMRITTSQADVNVLGRMGLGFTNQLANDMGAISFKVQRSRAVAMGVVLGFKAEDSETTFGAGVKLYRNIYEEPNLRFYMAGLLAAVSEVINNNKESGMQIDGTMGTEFHFNSIESVGFSFEVGVSVNTLGTGTTISTLGDKFAILSAHFYL